MHGGFKIQNAPTNLKKTQFRLPKLWRCPKNYLSVFFFKSCTYTSHLHVTPTLFYLQMFTFKLQEFLCDENAAFQASPGACSSLVRTPGAPFHTSRFPLQPVSGGQTPPPYPSLKGQNTYFSKNPDRASVQPKGVWGPWTSSSDCRFRYNEVRPRPSLI